MKGRWGGVAAGHEGQAGSEGGKQEAGQNSGAVLQGSGGGRGGRVGGSVSNPPASAPADAARPPSAIRGITRGQGRRATQLPSRDGGVWASSKLYALRLETGTLWSSRVRQGCRWCARIAERQRNQHVQPAPPLPSRCPAAVRPALRLPPWLDDAGQQWVNLHRSSRLCHCNCQPLSRARPLPSQSFIQRRRAAAAAILAAAPPAHVAAAHLQLPEHRRVPPARRQVRGRQAALAGRGAVHICESAWGMHACVHGQEAVS